MSTPWRYASLLPVILMTGCVATTPTYQSDHSKAYNIAQAAGMWRAEDFEATKDQGTDLASASFDIITGTAAFNTPHGLGLSLGKAAGLSVLSFMFSPPAQMERDTVLAWLPQSQANDPEEATQILANTLFEASIATLEEHGYPYDIEYRDRRRHALFDPYLESLVNFTNEDKTCAFRYELFPGEVSDLAPVPEFILPASQGYRFWAAHDIRYPKYWIHCTDAEPTENLTLVAEVSHRLPAGVFLYVAPKGSRRENNQTPPLVLDHGKALLFIEPLPTT
ncbi:hypothetical protein MHM84_20280 [Halomonas sp. McH1-25]|uniref:hypothetical protein n=1 Tax=unclassified Halomonas TaxID=2609666 RepID=UPI001EF4F620|nr:MULTISPECIES: hypothetical protein [unclassified Halomonas]MCG7602083.1 hypothetical protein [Halomonas sp. McH1-25]MCP1342999.1 hypothetical protein [Halomonas sp. FL8]MCP1362545.1 hypothetical protein [Halomonas sp. BBD45]MCP1364195.1 hypothetical protein [Halomonas sp. BBD48]